MTIQKKDKGVSTKIASDYYRMMEKTRIVLKNQHGIKVGSHIKLTNLMNLAPPLYKNKSWIRKVKKWTG